MPRPGPQLFFLRGQKPETCPHLHRVHGRGWGCGASLQPFQYLLYLGLYPEKGKVSAATGSAEGTVSATDPVTGSSEDTVPGKGTVPNFDTGPGSF